VSRVTTLPLRYEAEFDNGAYKATKDTLEIDQALVTFRLSEDWSLILVLVLFHLERDNTWR
jgi:hypothetical protein